MNINKRVLISDCIDVLQSGTKDYTENHRHLFGLLFSCLGVQIKDCGYDILTQCNRTESKIVIRNRKKLAEILILILDYTP